MAPPSTNGDRRRGAGGFPWRRAILLGVACFVAGRIGLLTPRTLTSGSPVWPVSGIALGGLWLLGRRAWPAPLLASLALGFSIHLPPVVVIAGAIGMTLEGLAGFGLLSVMGFDARLARFRDVLALMIAAALAPMLAAPFYALSMEHAGILPPHGAPGILLHSWLGSAMGVLLVAPAVLHAARLRPRVMTRRRVLETLALIAVFVLSVRATIFARPWPAELRYPLAFLTFPCTIWAALRFGPPAVACSNLLISCAVLLATLLGIGPLRGRRPGCEPGAHAVVPGRAEHDWTAARRHDRRAREQPQGAGRA